jgi:ribosomal protein L20A (L18A)
MVVECLRYGGEWDTNGPRRFIYTTVVRQRHSVAAVETTYPEVSGQPKIRRDSIAARPKQELTRVS